MQMYTVPEVASILKIGRTTVYKLLQEGAIGSIKIGSSRRVPHREIETYIEHLRTW
jgi:excisionase family DNA binding protein